MAASTLGNVLCLPQGMTLENDENTLSTVVLLRVSEDKGYFGAQHVFEYLLSQETIGTM
jgi:hypothetical protein